jgi:hypothetical protein
MADTMQLLTGERETRRCVTSAAGPCTSHGARMQWNLSPAPSLRGCRRASLLAATAVITAARRSVAGKAKWPRVIIAAG